MNTLKQLRDEIDSCLKDKEALSNLQDNLKTLNQQLQNQSKCFSNLELAISKHTDNSKFKEIMQEYLKICSA